MSNTDIEIVVDDPTAPEDDSPAVTSTRIADIVTSLLLLSLALTLGFDNWRTGAGWESTGPQPGYFPFYLSVILGGASLYGLIAAFLSRKEASEVFVTRAQLRRARTGAPATPAPMTIHGLSIDPVTRRVERDGRQIHLTPIEWQILSTLVSAGGRTLTHQQIFDAVWSRQFGSPQQYLRVHITNLRRKIEIDPASPRIVITEPGVGYRADVIR